MDYGLLMPEINSGRMYAGPGAGHLLAAAAAWDLVATQLESAAAGYSSTVSAMTGLTWFGPSSVSMAAAATRYIAWLQATAATAYQTSFQAYAAAAAYATAFAMTVPPWLVAANRAQLAALIATNFFGQNTAAIAACEAQYLEMWAQDAGAMYAYAAASSTASTMTSFQEPPQTTNDEGPDAQARSLAQTAANTTRARTQSLTQLSSSTQTTANALGVDPPLPVGESANVAAGGAIIDPGVAVAASTGNPVTATQGVQIFTITSVIQTFPGGGQLTNSAGLNITLGAPLQTLSGTFYYIGGGNLSFPSGAFTGTTINVPAIGVMPPFTLTGANVTELGGLVTAVNTGAVSTGPVVVPVVPVVPSSSGALAAAPAAAAPAPGLAGTAGIQPQLNVDALMDALAGVAAE